MAALNRSPSLTFVVDAMPDTVLPGGHAWGGWGLHVRRPARSCARRILGASRANCWDMARRQEGGRDPAMRRALLNA